MGNPGLDRRERGTRRRQGVTLRKGRLLAVGRSRQASPLGLIVGGLLLVTLLSVGLPSPAWAQRLVQVAEGVYLFRGTVNSGVIVTERGVVVVDTQISPALARRLLGEIRQLTSAPLAYVINTHYHGDHSYGNVVFAGEAPIIAHERTPGLMTAREWRMKDFYESRGLPVRSFPVVPPTLTFSDHLTLRLGEEVIEFRHLGKTETHDAIIWEVAWRVPSRFDRGDYVNPRRQAIEEALQLQPGEPLARLHRGLDMLDRLPFTGQPPEEALTEIRASLAAGLPRRGQAKAYYGLGLGHRAKEELQQAREAFQRALALEPELTPARDALAALQGR